MATTAQKRALRNAGQGAAVADLAAHTNLTAVPGSFADEAAVQTYLVTLRSEVEAALDALDAKVLALQNSLQGGGVIAP